MRGLYFALTVCFVLICVTAERRCGDEFDWKCKTGGGCIRDDYVCDRQEDCLDGSDEANCTMDGHFNCMDGGGFLKEEYVCDGEEDCEMGADEMNCTIDRQFSCMDGQYLNKEKVCDGVDDCEMGDDEKNCICGGLFNWKCATGGRCIQKRNVCNGKRDCWDGSDEMYCSCGGSKFNWECETGGQCISNYDVCDGVKDCWDGSDEFHGCSCDPRSDRPFQCKKTNGTTPYCIWIHQICNGKKDCPDGSDERNCQCRDKISKELCDRFKKGNNCGKHYAVESCAFTCGHCHKTTVGPVVPVVSPTASPGSADRVEGDVSGFTRAQAQTLVDRHNFHRAKEGATGMIKVTWDSVIAASAQRMADNCTFRHMPWSERSQVGSYGGVGENIYVTSRTFDFSVNRVVDAWASEIRYYHYDDNSCDKGKMCGHYTQVVWDSNIVIGCGVKKCPAIVGWGKRKGYIVFCQYGPPGNGRGQPFYKGEKCSNCPSFAPNCDSEYRLCSSKTERKLGRLRWF